MRKIVAADLPMVRSEKPREDAREYEAGLEQDYKVELIDDLPEGEAISFYTQGDFTDLCRGPHVASTGRIGAFKLDRVAGAYWRGDEKRPMLQRIYGVLYPTQAELDAHFERVEEARKRDHKVLGKQLGLFMNSPVIGPGLPLWLPKGATVRRVLERYIVDFEIESGYQHVYTPDMAKTELYKISGHLEHYQDCMFPIMKIDTEEFVLRPMCCPHHIQIYKNENHSYRELPIRIAEIGTMYRYEKSGELSGLSRVRAMHLNDAHIFCREDQVVEEVTAVVRLVEETYRKLGITQYKYRLSLHDPANKEKYVDNPAMWERAEGELRQVFEDLGLPFVEGFGEAAFYGPKIDIQLVNVMGREETVSTIQVDRHLPERFELGVQRRRQLAAPAGDDSPGRNFHDGADGLVLDRALRGRVPDLARAGAGAAAADRRPSPRLRAGSGGAAQSQRASGPKWTRATRKSAKKSPKPSSRKFHICW